MILKHYNTGPSPCSCTNHILSQNATNPPKYPLPLSLFLFFSSKIHLLEEEFEDTKRVIRIRKSKKDRKHYGQKKNDKRTNNDLQNKRSINTNPY